MFDKNYLGHNLVKLDYQTHIGIIYLCTKCNNRILHTKYYYNNTWHYKICNKPYDYTEDAMSCDEYIIKNIIE